MCIDGTNAAASVLGGMGTGTGTGGMGTAGRCHVARCVRSDLTLRVLVRGEWHTCERDFQRLTSNHLGTSTLTCPRLTAACPDMFCPSNCEGRGACDFDARDDDGRRRPRCVYFDGDAGGRVGGGGGGGASDGGGGGGGSGSSDDDGRYVQDGEGLYTTSPGAEEGVLCSTDSGENGFFDRIGEKVKSWSETVIDWWQGP